MAEVEDVAGPRAGALEQFLHLGAQFVDRREQRHRVQVALNGRAVADVHPSLVDIDAPVHAHHVAAGGVQFLKNPDAPVPKWITGTPVERMRSISAREYGAA